MRVKAKLTRYRRVSPLTVIAFMVIAIYGSAALFAPWIAPYGETQIVAPPYLPWEASHPLGTDQLGRDFLSRLIFGARNTIGIALATTLLAFGLGLGVGLLAAMRGGWIDNLLSRTADILLSMPQLIFALLLLTLFGATVVNLILILALLDCSRVMRVARAAARDVIVQDFIEAAHLRGDPLSWIMRREILPNILPPVIAELGLRFCFVFLSVSALSFLGVGIQPPSADWGSMVRENAGLISYGDITPILPALAIAVLTVAVNFICDAYLERISGARHDG